MPNLRHLLWLVVASVGCASPMSELRADNHRLNDTVAQLRADRRAQDRKIRDLEHQVALARETTAAETPVPQLPVEVVTPPPRTMPSDQRVVGTTDDGTEIIYEGDAAAGKPATLDVDPGALRELPGSDTPPAHHHASGRHVAARSGHAHVRDTGRDTGSDDGAVTEYRAAVALVKDAHYADAIAALRAFLQHYPRHDYADNAQYWLGEAYYAQRDYQHALAEFRATIEIYPRGNKVPDALLKVGYCYQALGQADKARAVLQQVVNLYPASQPAVLAAKRLETP